MAGGGREMEFTLAFAGKLDPSLASAIDNIVKKTSAFDKKTGLTKGLQKAGSVGLKAMKAVGKAVAVATTAAATGVAAITTASVKSYADYEQLVGGVDTLFKGSSKQVQDYASKAYETAGLSANQYMETITSFSASLLQSLGGDTQRAAEMGDMAVIDMADNANKMGTNIEDIQRAYQSLARGQYGMLDNLKLGYGGVKSEAERLIKDANEIRKANGEAADLSIEKFGDMVQAIHTVQDAMGISGTTHEEAMKTISGSINATKAAWDNWLVGLSNPNADLSALTEQLLTMGTTAGGLIFERVQQALSRLGPFIAQKGPELVSQFANGLMSAAGTLLPIGLSLVTSIIQGISASAPTIISSGFQLILNLGQGLLQMAPSLFAMGFQIVGLLLQGIAQNGPTIIAMGVQLIGQFAQACASYLPVLIPLGVQAILNLAQGIASNIPTIISYAVQIIVALAQGIAAAIPMIVQQGPQIIASLVTGIISGLGQLIQCGWEILGALAQGIMDAIGSLGGAIWDALVRMFTGQPLETPEIDTSATEASLQSVPDAAQSAADQATTALGDIQVPEVDMSNFDLGNIEIPEVDTSGLDLSGLSSAASGEVDNVNSILSNIGSGASVTVGSADFSPITTAAQAAADNVKSTFSNLGTESATAVTSGLQGVTYDALVSKATAAKDQTVQAFSTLGPSIQSAVSAGAAAAGNSFAVIVSSAQMAASSVTAAFTGVGSGISAAITAALSASTAAFSAFTAAGTSSAMQVMAAQMAAAMMVMSIWTSSLAMVAARAIATSTAFFQMAAAGQSAAASIAASMSGVAGTISGITSAALSAASALSAMASAARSAASAAASASAAKAAGFATGGVTNGPGVVGEDPRYPHEFVITPNPAYRAQNKGYLAMAARALGMTIANTDSLDKDPWTLGGQLINDEQPITSNYEMHTTMQVNVDFSPHIEIKGNAREDDIIHALEKVEPDFEELLHKVLNKAKVGDYAFSID